MIRPFVRLARRLRRPGIPGVLRFVGWALIVWYAYTMAETAVWFYQRWGKVPMDPIWQLQVFLFVSAPLVMGIHMDPAVKTGATRWHLAASVLRALHLLAVGAGLLFLAVGAVVMIFVGPTSFEVGILSIAAACAGFLSGGITLFIAWRHRPTLALRG